MPKRNEFKTDVTSPKNEYARNYYRKNIEKMRNYYNNRYLQKCILMWTREDTNYNK